MRQVWGSTLSNQGGVQKKANESLKKITQSKTRLQSFTRSAKYPSTAAKSSRMSDKLSLCPCLTCMASTRSVDSLKLKQMKSKKFSKSSDRTWSAITSKSRLSRWRKRELRPKGERTQKGPASSWSWVAINKNRRWWLVKQLKTTTQVKLWSKQRSSLDSMVMLSM